jgi:hypothetical protein
MVRTAALALLVITPAAAAPPPWEADWPADLAWAWQGNQGSRYWVRERDVQRHGTAGGVSVWVHGDHTNDRGSTYRRSLRRIELTCGGGYYDIAFTTYRADGSVIDSWDGRGSYTNIRPDSAYASLQAEFCQRN